MRSMHPSDSFQFSEVFWRLYEKVYRAVAQQIMQIHRVQSNYLLQLILIKVNALYYITWISSGRRFELMISVQPPCRSTLATEWSVGSNKHISFRISYLFLMPNPKIPFIYHRIWVKVWSWQLSYCTVNTAINLH